MYSYKNRNSPTIIRIIQTRKRRRSEMNGEFIVDQNQVEQIEGMTSVYPYCMHQRDLSNILIPWHWHEELELGFIERGTSKIITLDGTFEVHAGEGFFINSNVLDMKTNAVPGTPVLEINHIFHPVFLTGHFKSIFETKYIAPVTNNKSISVYVIRRGNPITNQLLDNLRMLYELQSRENVEFETRNILSECWLLLSKELSENTTLSESVPNAQKERLQHMISFIHQNFNKKITAAQIAAVAHVSEREAIRTFKKNIGMSPIEYVLSYRLNESLKYLIDPDLTIKEICFLCGFSESAYFGKTFKKHYGMTPSEYRMKYR